MAKRKHATDIRPARNTDADALAALWMQFLGEQARLDARFVPADDALVRWRNDFPRWLADGTRRILVAERDGEVAGFLTAHRWAPAPIYAYSSEVYVDELYVRPEARRNGLGRGLVEAVRRWAGELGAGRLRLTMLAENAAGRAFWEQMQARPFSVSMTIELDRTGADLVEPKRAPLGFA